MKSWFSQGDSNRYSIIPFELQMVLSQRAGWLT
jgi:hypothetical protein